MKNNLLNLAIGCCAVFFCGASVYAQVDSCSYLKRWKDIQPFNEQEYADQKDTLELFIERCAASDNESWRVFSTITAAVQFLSVDTARFDTYRNWLIKVLYLNKTNPEYFCVCIGQIASTYQVGKFNPLGYLAVLNYLRQNHPECWDAASDESYAKDSTYDAQNGFDPSHLPSLDSMGLGFLLKSGVAAPSASLTSSYIASFSSSPNPFIKKTTLEFTLNHMAFVTLSIYDELGRLVWGDGKGSSLEAGMHVIHLDGSSLPSGTLYARIATGFGEVKTVKLIHEK